MWSSGHDSALTRAKLCDWTGLSLAAAAPAVSPAPSRGAGRGLAAVRPAYDGPTVLGLGVADSSQPPPSLSSVAPSPLISATPGTLTSSTATPPSLSQSPASSSDEAHAVAASRSAHPVSMASVPHVSACEAGGTVGVKLRSAIPTNSAAGMNEGGPAIEQHFVRPGVQVLPRWFDRLPEKGLSKVELWLQDSTDCSKFGRSLRGTVLPTYLHADEQSAQPVQAWLKAGHAQLEGTNAMLRGDGTIRRA